MTEAERRNPIVVVLPPGALLLDLAGPLEVVRAANAARDKVRFDVSYVAPKLLTRSSVGLLLSGAATLPQAVEDCDVILVPRLLEHRRAVVRGYIRRRASGGERTLNGR